MNDRGNYFYTIIVHRKCYTNVQMFLPVVYNEELCFDNDGRDVGEGIE